MPCLVDVGVDLVEFVVADADVLGGVQPRHTARPVSIDLRGHRLQVVWSDTSAMWAQVAARARPVSAVAQVVEFETFRNQPDGQLVGNTVRDLRWSSESAIAVRVDAPAPDPAVVRLLYLRPEPLLFGQPTEGLTRIPATPALITGIAETSGV